jgi:prepilin-type N-terminal cleavage/methylation domain-containing protein
MQRTFSTHKRTVCHTGGFTLVELMVSLTVFSIIMLISTGVLLVMVDVNAKGQALYASYSNLTFALDSMTREIRTGRNYYCNTSENAWPSNGSVRDCANGTIIVFDRGFSNEQMGYRLTSTGRIEQRIADGEWFAITAEEVVVNEMVLDVESTSNSDGEQPRVDIRVAGALYNGLAEPTDFEISTRVVQRVLDR